MTRHAYVIVGCGRVGAMLAAMLDDGGHEVTILDISTSAFDRLPSTFKGNALRGDGTDEDTLRAGRRGERRPVPGDDRGRQPQHHGRPARGRGLPGRPGDRQDQRPAPGPGLRRAGHRDDLPDRPDDQRDPLPPQAAGRRRARRPIRQRPAPPRRPAPKGPSGARPGHRAIRRPTATASPGGSRSAPSTRSITCRLGTAAPRAGGLSRVRPGHRRRQGRLLPGQGAARLGPRGGPDGEGPGPCASQIADEIGSIVVAHDGCEGKYLAEAGCNRADVVAAVTGDDEDNLVICQMAKHHFDVPRTIARVNNPEERGALPAPRRRRADQPDPDDPGLDRAGHPGPRAAPPGGPGRRRARADRGPPPALLAGRRPATPATSRCPKAVRSSP